MTADRVSRTEWKRELYESFRKVRRHSKRYRMQSGKFGLIVLPNVFSPKYFTDSEWFAERLPLIVGRKRFLEIGTGTGICAIYCAAAGATVTATDINPDAVRNARANEVRTGNFIDVRFGDMYAPIGADEKFDFIFWNHPFNSWNDTVPDMLMRAGVDPNYEGLRCYIREGKNHLKEGGLLLLGSSDMAESDKIEEIGVANGYRLTVLESGEMPIEDGSHVMNTYFIYRLDKI